MKSAKGKPCTVRIPGACNFNPETTVIAHVNSIRFGKGVGIKSAFGAFCCSSCHDVLDGRVPPTYTKDKLALMHYEGVLETLMTMEKEGLVKL